MKVRSAIDRCWTGGDQDEYLSHVLDHIEAMEDVIAASLAMNGKDVSANYLAAVARLETVRNRRVKI